MNLADNDNVNNNNNEDECRKREEDARENTENKLDENTDLDDKFIEIDAKKKDEVYIEYDNTALDKLLSLKSNKNHTEKLQYITRIGELIYVIGENGISKLSEILNSIVTDTDKFKKALCTQFDSLIKFFLERGDKGYNEIIEHLIPVVYNLLRAKNFEIKKKAGKVMMTIANHLTDEDKGKHILPMCLNMAHDDHSEDNRIVAIQLIGGMTINFSKDLYEQFIALEFLSLSEDPQFKVRREVAKNLATLGKMVSSRFFNQRLLPVYYRLCDDPAPEIKLSCIENIIDIANMTDPTSRQSTLTEKYLEFLKETHRQVKISAYKKLGPFIAQLQNLKVNEQLIEAYIHMPDYHINEIGDDNEIIIACAYNFPAVLLTLGASRWPQLRRLFMTLIREELRVKKPLACALHEIASIIGEEQTESDLFSIMMVLLHDKVDEIKYGVIKNIGLFLKVFNIQKRESMADYFCELQRNDKKWRIRELIAGQIDILASIFAPNTVFQIISPISFKLCCDPVAIVREKASSNIHPLLFNLYNTEHKNAIIENIKVFSVAHRYTYRQTYINMCDKLMDKIEIFEKDFMKNLINLEDDKVINVRLSLARLLRKKFNEQCPIIFNKEMLFLIQRLQMDASKDVRMLLEDLVLPLPDLHHILNSPLKNKLSPSVVSPKEKDQHASNEEQSDGKMTKPVEDEQIPNANQGRNECDDGGYYSIQQINQEVLKVNKTEQEASTDQEMLSTI